MKMGIVAVLAALLLGAVEDEGAVTPVTTETTTTALELAAPRNDVKGVGNFAKISDTLYRGSQPTAEGFAALKAMGVKTVVNLRAYHSDRDELKGIGLRYFHVSCKAWHPEEADIVQFLKIIREPGNRPVFVHCQHGADRTGMMVAAYRIVEQGWSAEDAVKEVRNFGFHEVFAKILTYLAKLDPEHVREAIDKDQTKR